MGHLIVNGDARRIPLPDNSVHCVVTSPPYFQLRDYKSSCQIGKERTVREYVANISAVFREVKRVLRDDGIAWMVIGDTYSQYNGGRGKSHGENSRHHEIMPGLPSGFGLSDPSVPAGNLFGVPWRVGFALQDDGWIVRSENIWHKKCPMPESVKTRTTRSHEQVFQLAKSTRYYYDWVAVLEPSSEDPATKARRLRNDRGSVGSGGLKGTSFGQSGLGKNHASDLRNLRSVWSLTTKPFKGSHFATYPQDLVSPCIKASTSNKGQCRSCGTPWARMVDSYRTHNGVRVDDIGAWRNTDPGSPIGAQGDGHWRYSRRVETLGWKPGCSCDAGEPVPCVVLDPFSGAATTGLVAANLGRDYVGIELNPDYCRMSRERLTSPGKPKRTAKKASSVACHPLQRSLFDDIA